MLKMHHILFLMIICGLTSCTPRSIREAQSVVVLADSLRAEGCVYSDSAQLAQAYHTLHRSRAVYPDEYAHACYHYGKLLRAKDDPVAAMQCFINASHSRTHDYHILGRIYSNMSDLCHLASEFPLAYDMYERSGEMYLRNGDTLLYYYDLNNMAYELAEQSRKEETLEMLSKIESQCSDKYVLAKVQETKAEMYLKCQQNDSAIYWAHQSLAIDDTNPTCVLIKAQAFSQLEINDSALFYANIVLNNPYASKQNIFNALYYTSHLDSTLSSKDVCTLTSQREDIRYYEYEPQMKKLKDAVRLLQQTLMHKPNLGWLYTLLGTLLTGAVLISWYISRKRKKHELLSQHINDLENKNRETIARLRQQVEDRCSIIVHSPVLKEDLCWNDFDIMCNVINQHFGLLASKLQQSYHLSEREIRLCVLTLLNLGYDQMAEMLYYAPNGIGKFKLRVARKLGTTAKNLRQFLIEMIIDK